MSWHLASQDYGRLSAALSVLAVLFVLGMSIQTFVSKRVSEREWTRAMRNWSGRNILTLSAGALTVLALLSPWMTRVLRMTALEWGLLLAIFLIHIAVSYLRGIFQGRKKFYYINISLYVENLTKLLIVLLLIPAYPTVFMTLIAVLMGMLFSLGIAVWQAFRLYRKPSGHDSEQRTPAFWNVYIFILGANFFFYFFTSFDMIIVNYHLPELSGAFAVVLKYSQLLLFVVLSLITLFLPYLNETVRNRRKFIKTGSLLVAIVGFVEAVALVFYFTILEDTVTLFFGEEYVEAAQYLGLGAMVYCVFVFIMVFVNINIALERYRYMLFMGGGAIALVVLLNTFHASLTQILWIELSCYAAIFLLILLDTLYSLKRRTYNEKY